MRLLRRLGNWTPMPPSMWSGFATSRAAAAINGGGSDPSGSAAFPRLLLRQALLQGGNQVDNIAASRLRRRCLAFLSLRLVFDQLFHVLGVGVVIFGGIEFCRHALDQLQGKIDFVGDQLLVDRQAELVGRAYFRGETEGV